MPRNSAANRIVYPAGCKEITEDLATDDLVRRMKDISMAFQQMSQEDDNDGYIPLANLLVTDHFLEHPSRDVRLLVACAIADVFRVYAPNAPYQRPELIKRIFLFFIQQLKGLQDPRDPTFKRYFYLLENLAWVKSFNICIELDDSQSIFCQLFSLIFRIVNDNHSEKVKNFMLDMLSPLIIESDTVSMKLVEIILFQLIEPKRTTHRQACWLSTQILKKTCKTMEPYLITYFNNAITHGIQANGGDLSDDEDNTSQQSAANQAPAKTGRISRNAPNANKSITQLCELIYELNKVCPSIMSGIMPQLEFKIRSNEEKERCEFTKLLARLFSDNKCNLAQEHPELWKSFLGRFRDISVTVRTRCVQYAMHFLVNQPTLRHEITEQLRQRQHDPDENVRYEVVMAIISAAKKGIENVNEDLLGFVKERTLDKKFKIRREALFGMAFLYKQCNFTSGDYEQPTDAVSTQQIRILQWIKNKCMHNYFQTQLDDRLLVERILHMFLIPYSAPLAQRMKILYCFYATIDAHAARAFNQLLKQQLNVRKQVKEVLDILKQEKNEERDALLKEKIQLCAKSLPEAVKAEEYITKLCKNLELNPALRQHMDIIVDSTSSPQLSDEGTVLSPPSCSTIELSVKEVLKSLGFPVQTNSFYVVVKQLMERIAPVMIDSNGLFLLFDYVQDSLLGPGNYDLQFNLRDSSKRGLQLILALSTVFPAIFFGKEIFSYYLLPFLWNSGNPEISELVLQILTNIGNSMNYEGCNQEMITSIPWWAAEDDAIPKIIDKFILKATTTKQAKYAVQCLNAIINDDTEKQRVFGEILDNIKTSFSLDSSHFRIHLVTTGMIATCGGHIFFPKLLRSIIQKYVVQNLLLKDQRLEEEIATLEASERQRNSSDHTVTYEFCSEEVKCKVEGIKLMVRWLYGLKLGTLQAQEQQATHAEEIGKYHKYCENTLNLLRSIVQNQGDLNDKGLGGTRMEKAHMRLAAAIAMIKIVSNDAITQLPTNSVIDNQTPPIATSSTSPIMSPQQWHALGTLMLDSEEFVRDRFALKLHKGLVSLSLGLEFLAILSLAGYYDSSSPFRLKLRQYLLMNLAKRRDISKTKNIANLKSVFPECVMPFVIHLIAHMPFYTQYDDVVQLQKVKDCLWFIMEPLVLKNEHFSFSFFKRTFENIKTCIDKVSASAEQSNGAEADAQPIFTMTNYKIYCACDLALGLVMSKTQNFLLKEYPVQPSLPGKYYMVSPLAKDNNMKNYLPPEMHFAPPKRCGLETEILGKITKPSSNASTAQSSSSNNSASNGTTRTRSTRAAAQQQQVVNVSTSNGATQIVLLASMDPIDGNVIDTEPHHMAIIGGEQTAQVMHVTGGEQASIYSVAADNSVIIDQAAQSVAASDTSTSTRSRKQELVITEDELDEAACEPSSKRVRCETTTNGGVRASTNGGVRTSRSGARAAARIAPVEHQEEEEMMELGDAPASDAPKPRRGRPPKNPAQAEKAVAATASESSSAELANLRKSSRLRK